MDLHSMDHLVDDTRTLGNISVLDGSSYEKFDIDIKKSY